jgi:hypothetical protein
MVLRQNVSMLTKLKYAGLSRAKLIHIYSLHVRSSMEYCSVMWHDNLTQAQSNALERLQIVSLKIILGSDCQLKKMDILTIVKLWTFAS